jgi:hypothetical protein
MEDREYIELVEEWDEGEGRTVLSLDYDGEYNPEKPFFINIEDEYSSCGIALNEKQLADLVYAATKMVIMNQPEGDVDA